MAVEAVALDLRLPATDLSPASLAGDQVSTAVDSISGAARLKATDANAIAVDNEPEAKADDLPAVRAGSEARAGKFGAADAGLKSSTIKPVVGNFMPVTFRQGLVVKRMRVGKSHVPQTQSCNTASPTGVSQCRASRISPIR